MGLQAGVVLVVEDDQNDRLLIAHVFRKSVPNVHLHLSKDSFDAEDYLLGNGSYGDRASHALPHLILLDLKLPLVVGIEVLRKVKRDPRTRTIPVVVMTSSSEERDIYESYHLGVNSYVVKPVDFEQFSESIRQIGNYWLQLNQPPVPSP